METLNLKLSVSANRALNQDGITLLRSLSLIQSQTYQVNLAFYDGETPVTPALSSFSFFLRTADGADLVSVNAVNSQGGDYPYYFILPVTSPFLSTALGTSAYADFRAVISYEAAGVINVIEPFASRVFATASTGTNSYVATLNGLGSDVLIAGAGLVSIGQSGQTITINASGDFYPNSNPSGFINSSALAPYATSSGLSAATGTLQGQITTLANATGSYYNASNPAGYIDSSALTPYAQISTLNSASGVLQSQISQIQNTTGNFLTSAALAPYETIAAAASTSGTLQAQISSLNTTTGHFALNTTTVFGSGLATGGGTLAGNLVLNVPIASQAQAEAGTDDATAMTPLKVKQSIATAPVSWSTLTGKPTTLAGFGITDAALQSDFLGLEGTVSSLVSSAFDPAHPVSIGTSTPNTATFTNLTVSTINGANITTASGGTLTLGGSTLTVNNTITLATDGTGTRTLNINAGGTLGSAAFANLSSLGTIGCGAITSTGNSSLVGGVIQPNTNGIFFNSSTPYIYWSGGSRIVNVSAGVMQLTDTATASTFTRLNLGGLTTSYPALARNGVNLESRLADGSALSGMRVSQTLVDTTLTTSGSTGAKTINKGAGSVRIAAAGTSVVVTNSLVTTSSIVFAQCRTADSTAWVKNVVSGSGSFTITLGASATAETDIAWLIVNP